MTMETGVVQQLLGQVQWEQTGTMAVAVIAALGGQKGIEALIRAWRGRQGSSRSDSDARHAKEYPCVLHEQFEKHLDERHHAVLAGIQRVEESVTRVHERLDEMGRGR